MFFVQIIENKLVKIVKSLEEKRISLFYKHNLSPHFNNTEKIIENFERLSFYTNLPIHFAFANIFNPHCQSDHYKSSSSQRNESVEANGLNIPSANCSLEARNEEKSKEIRIKKRVTRNGKSQMR